jgi:hypothetical protein
MNSTELDLMPVASLSDRYKVARSNVYNRLSALQIEPEKQSGKAFINADQLAQMDQLDQHLKTGGTLGDFPGAGGNDLSYRPMGQVEKSYRTQDKMPDLSQPMALAMGGMVEAIAAKIYDLMVIQTPQLSDPLANLRTLEEAYQNKWLLSSSQLAPLLGLKGLPSGEAFQRHGFIFTRSGKNGVESAWKITKFVADLGALLDS